MKGEKTPSQKWMEALMPTRLTHATKSVAWAISNRCYGLKDESNPSYLLIAKEAGVSAKNIRLHIKELEDAGWLEINQKTNSINRPYNIYTLTYPQIEESHDETPQITALTPQITASTPQFTALTPQETGGISNKEAREEVMEEAREEVKDNQEEEQALDALSLDELVKKTSCVRDDFPLDALQPFTLIGNSARDEHKEKSWLEKSHDRQAQINAEILAEMEDR